MTGCLLAFEECAMRPGTHVWIVAAAVVLWSCGDGRLDADAAQAGKTGVSASTSSTGRFKRESFVLCPALEGHREELAAIVGFKPDSKRPLAVIRSECIVNSMRVGFARVTLVSAGMTLGMHVKGFDAAASPAPELGPEAMFVDGKLQPHVVFAMGPLVIDVDAENLQTPSRETMIRLATRVRDILAEANR